MNAPEESSPRFAKFLRNVNLTAAAQGFSPRSATYTPRTNHDSSFTYDAAGDVIRDGQGRVYTYDAQSMATGVSLPLTGGSTRNFRYLYTADDERIGLVEQLPAGETRTRWTLRGLDNHLLRTWMDSTSAGTHSWAWMEDEIWRSGSVLAYDSPAGIRHDGLDHLGSPVIVTDAAGNLIGNVAYDAFGTGGATGAGMLQFTGHERDSTTVGPQAGTVRLPDYMHARYYDANGGRFLSIDPAGSYKPLTTPQAWNRYSYARNNPIVRIDPDGLRDIYVMFWNDEFPFAGQSGSVGHVAAFEMNGRVLLSQFPRGGGVYGDNLRLTYDDTLHAERRRPDRIFRVFVPNDRGFDAAVDSLKSPKTRKWFFIPMHALSQTNCVDSVQTALVAGGVHIDKVALAPEDLLDWFERHSGTPPKGQQWKITPSSGAFSQESAADDYEKYLFSTWSLEDAFGTYISLHKTN